VTDSTAIAELAYKNEVRRKLFHLFALSIPIGYHFVPRVAAILIPLACWAMSVVVDLARIRNWAVQRLWCRLTDPIVRPKERAGFTGATFILASAWLCPLLFVRSAAAMGMTAIILGDVAAALVGRRWGTHRYHNNRSVDGSAAFLAAATIGCLIIPGVPLGLALSAALLATIVEGLSQKIDDNLTVPLIVGLYVHLALRLL
jgi:dolichol kinase